MAIVAGNIIVGSQTSTDSQNVVEEQVQTRKTQSQHEWRQSRKQTTKPRRVSDYHYDMKTITKV